MTETTIAPDEKTTNTPKDFMIFFSAPAFSGPSPECKPKEYREFWTSCTEEEKAAFRIAKLS